MVHRAPDSRLLTNLIAHEKEYVRHLAGLFPLSHSALASLSAYAAASPAHPSSPAQTIAAVVNVLAGVDDALQRYNQALETWREQLVSLKDLEDDLSAILRDRDILVTRLIKASKSTREAHRSSRLMAPLTGLGSASLSSLPSTNSTGAVSSSGPASTNAKLAQAQAELQACEAHLVNKERELDARRISIARDGLGARCRALIDCGWVWGEMGKQGLKALQALSANGVGSGGHIASTPLPAAIPPHLNLATYASDNSSLTPSQSASQTAARSAETSHESPASKERERSAEREPKSKLPAAQARTTRADEEDLTLPLPPAHAISDIALPTGVRSRTPQNGDPAAQKPAPSDTSLAPAPRRKRIKGGRRPPSQHITEVSDEGSNEPSTSDPNPPVLRTPFPTTRPEPGMDDTSSEENQAIGPFEIVENNPFEVIRRSILGPSPSVVFLPAAPSPPSANASAPDVRENETSPSKAAGSVEGLTPGSAKRERRTSMAFFGSIRGLFRKPKDRDRVATEWDEGRLSSSPPSPNRTKTNGKGGRGWVTRTDARIKGWRSGGDDSDDDPTPTPRAAAPKAPAANVARRGSSRLRKGRPAPMRGIHGNGSSASIPVISSPHARVDGWMTDSPAGTGPGPGTSRSRTQQGTIKRRKKSVADLRGGDEGHTDGEMEDRGGGERWSLEPESGKGRGMSLDVSVAAPKPKIEVERGKTLARLESNARSVPMIAVPITETNVSQGAQPRRSTTTTATSIRKPSTGGTPMHRRSASLSLIDINVRSASPSSQGSHSPTSTSGMSWRKPPPQLELPSKPESPSQFQTPPQTPTRTQTESQPKQDARRHLGNGHATHAKHTHNQSLMSIVADVTRQNESGSQVRDWDRDRTLAGVDVVAGTDKARSLDILRAPGSVLREVERGREPPAAERGMATNGRGHANAASVDDAGRGVGPGQGQGPAGQRPIKLPLRSALRNASRTPSPSPATILAPVPVAVGNGREVKKEGAVQADTRPVQVEEGRVRKSIIAHSLRDSASISSYETTRESFYVEEREVASSPSPTSPTQSQSSPSRSRPHSPPLRSQSPSPAPPSRSRTPPPPPSLSFTFPPPPVDPPPVQVTQSSSNTAEQPPSSTASTETPPVRRKSVRVSLQPTFSPTPPALCDEDGEECAPWSGSFSSRGEGGKEREKEHVGRTREHDEKRSKKVSKPQEDMWADSSEEDEEYSRARRLLSLVGKHDESKGKGKARAKT